MRVADRYSCPGDLPHWLEDHLPELETDPYVREHNGVMAVSLLQRFVDDPSLWRDCSRLNCWEPSANRTFQEYLAAWAGQLRREGSIPRVLPLLIQESFFRSRAETGQTAAPAPD